MTMRFRYSPVLVHSPVLTLGGRSVRPRPIVDCAVIGPTNTVVTPALLDSGADECIFSELIAVQIGLKLSAAPSRTTNYLRLGNTPIRYGAVIFRSTDGIEFREWSALVAFARLRMPYALLGFAGCLQFFDSCFFGAREGVELTVNPTYPGT
jgi:hypothetical protein